jgi:cyclophilin family peptidyl-prolyl cis-trans isomerase
LTFPAAVVTIQFFAALLTAGEFAMRTARHLLVLGVLLLAGAPPARSSDSDPERTDALKGEVLPSGDVVVIRTNHGDIKIKLYPKQAPKTVANFLGYVDARFYEGLVFHRVISDFMIQGGGLDAAMKEKAGRDPIPNESDNGLTNKRGTIAVARASDLNSGRSQFYINLKNNDFLDKAKYCVFGEVIEGMEVVDKIAKVQTGSKGVHQNVPVQPVIIQSIRRGS